VCHHIMTAGVENVAAFEAQLVAQVVDSLAMYMMENARFMAERLHAEFPKEVNHYPCSSISGGSCALPADRADSFVTFDCLTMGQCPCRATLTCWEYATSGAIKPIQHMRSCEVCSPLPCYFVFLNPSIQFMFVNKFLHAGCTSAQSRYMFAICCMKLGKYGEAEKALEAEGTPVCTSATAALLLVATLPDTH
jgi:hypothetical protein